MVNKSKRVTVVTIQIVAKGLRRMTNEQAQLIISLLQQLNKTLVEVEKLEKFIVGELQKAAKDEKASNRLSS